ncbi:MAG: transposase [Gemmatimonadales bacterium]|nr:transposase [Gemmatimonadota bacterium]MCL4213521.1 transposase [Gemmatimonadales bacterium]
MRKSKWTKEQIIGLLQQAEAGTPVTEICRREGLSKETFYRSRKKYGGLQVPDAKRLRQLEEENRALRRVVADQALNLQVLMDVLGKAW